MVMRVARMKVLGLVAALVTGLVVAPTTGPAQAATTVTTASVARHRMTPTELRHWLIGKHLGPNRLTYGGVITITGWTYKGRTRAGRPIFTPKTRITDGWASRMGPVAPVGGAQPAGLWDNCWCNPFTWDWSDWFGSLWTHLVDCAKGAATGVFVQASGELILKVAMQVAKRVLQTTGWQGYAVMAIGGCVYGAMAGGN